MTNDPNDIVRIASGTLVEMTALQNELEDAGVPCRVVGDDLTAGLGSTLPGSVELWIHRSDAVRAEALIAGSEKHAHHSKPKFPHPESDAKPGRPQGPHHQPEPHRRSP